MRIGTCGWFREKPCLRSGFDCKSTAEIDPPRAYICSSCPDGLLRRLLCISVSLFLVCYLGKWHWLDRLSRLFVTSPLPTEFQALGLDTVRKLGIKDHSSGAARHLTPLVRTSCKPAMKDTRVSPETRRIFEQTRGVPANCSSQPFPTLRSSSLRDSSSHQKPGDSSISLGRVPNVGVFQRPGKSSTTPRLERRSASPTQQQKLSFHSIQLCTPPTVHYLCVCGEAARSAYKFRNAQPTPSTSRQ